MKDEHDKSTIDLAIERKPAPLPAMVLMERDQRQRQGMITFLPVSMVALEWGVSARRIRALLCAGRLEGTQHENGYWDVHYPYTMTEGRRGPLLRKYGHKKQEQRAV